MARLNMYERYFVFVNNVGQLNNNYYTITDEDINIAQRDETYLPQLLLGAN